MPPGAGAARDQALDGLRGLAAIAVVLSHSILLFGVLPVAPHGGIGVVVFFALSGYLIAGICWSRPPSATAYKAFVRRRVLRLGPALAALLIVAGPLLVVVAGLDPATVLTSSLLALAQVMGFAIVGGADVVVAYHPTWSLGVEWVFYLAFPLGLTALRRADVGPRRVTLVLGAAALGLYGAGLLLPAPAFYYLPVANLGVLVAGGALATRGLGGAPPFAGSPRVAGGALALLVILALMPNPGSDSVWHLVMFPATAVASLLVIDGCRVGASATRALGRGTLPAVGRRAYSLYLWHLPAMWVVSAAASDLPGVVQLLVSWVTVACVVAVSFELFERPVLRRGSTGSRTWAARPAVDRVSGSSSTP